MKDGMLVVDSVVHAHDFRREMMVSDEARLIRGGVRAFATAMATKGPAIDAGAFDNPPDPEWASQVLFDESDTDFAVAQTVPLLGLFKEGLSPACAIHEWVQTRPNRLVFCGGVDPLYQGVRGAAEEMERQVTEWGAVSFKFYQAQTPRTHWRADDAQLAFPMYEKAIELGVKSVQFHKGMPLGLEPVEFLHPGDLQRAALEYPELKFIVHHLGEPYFDEMLNIASRYRNIYLILAPWYQQYFIEPWAMLHRLGRLLLYVGADRLCYGTDAVLWPGVQGFIDMWAELEMPDELQERYGYPPLTREIKAKIFGTNIGAAMGIDFAAGLEGR